MGRAHERPAHGAHRGVSPIWAPPRPARLLLVSPRISTSTKVPMSKTRFALCVLMAGLFAGCTSDSSSAMGEDGGGGGGGGGDDGDVPFPNGGRTLSGAAEAGYVDGARKVARFSDPVNVAYHDGMLYVADFDNGKLRAIDVNTHVTSTVINQKGFARPFGLAFPPDATLPAPPDNTQAGSHDPMSGTIWKVDVQARTAAVVAG